MNLIDYKDSTDNNRLWYR